MKKITSILFSMQTMGMLILIFAASIGTATFIENDYGATAAKAVVYNTTWFNILMLLLSINLVANIFIYKMYTWEKFTVFLFHISFLVVLFGSAITRFVSYEGMMSIREGQTSNSMLTDQAFVSITLSNNNETVSHDEKTKLSVLTPNAFKSKIEIGDKNFRFKTVKYVPNAREVLTELQQGGDPYIVLVASRENAGRMTYQIKNESSIKPGAHSIHFGSTPEPDAINIRYSNGALEILPLDTLFTMSMAGGPSEALIPGNWYPFNMRMLYRTSGLSIVLTNFYESAGTDFVPYTGNEGRLMDALVVEVSSGSETKQVALRGGKGFKGVSKSFSLNGTDIRMTFGSKEIVLPFSLTLKDFQLERYPGSMSPSSYASEVTLEDERNNIRKDHRIFMNNVLNYGGYRFFQSSYDTDEKGTVLSVNHDYWGTLFTYIGYGIMTLGMFLSLFSRSTRFAQMGKVIRNKTIKTKNVTAALLVLLMFSASGLYSQQHGHLDTDKVPVVDKQLAENFGSLLVQAHDGRLKPINTLSSELLRKLTRKDKLLGMNADQVFLGMLSEPLYWQQVALIKVKNPQLQGILGIEGKYASYLDFIDMGNNTYKLSELVSAAYAKKPSQRSMLDKDVMKVDERLNISFMIYKGEFLKILPNPNDPYATWHTPSAHLHGLSAEDSLYQSTVVADLLISVRENDVQRANELVNSIAAYQKKFGAEIYPPESKTQMEITYNRMSIFDNLSLVYGLLGMIMIILVFVDLFRNSKIIGVIVKGIIVLVIVGFIFQTAGLALRWYISGHAPWSDGYESLIYIAWVTLLAGLVFSKRSNMTIAATTILTSIILMVAHLSWMDPEITNLVPVLKSYWLTIHVSIITASYGFLALGMLLGFFNLLLMALKNKKNAEMLELRIKNLSAINERALTIGLYMLTIGTFLGGVWANESWGRYWGWDPKETWALVSVLLYSFILHMRFIPGVKGNYAFNFASLIGYFSILMTYFGVNYYLSGLHSYASGDPVPIPDFVYYTLAVIAVLAIWAYINERKFVKEEPAL
ncbi:MAG: c-type cytochrome biogenesis protein CcsB [Bacteroidales bacterium]|nr:c-type cytochrome biogenesis protein CcsB [Bacteroidales bacterium]